jgi:hypothetical protein
MNVPASGDLTLGVNSSAVPCFDYDPSSNVLTLGDSIGAVVVDQQLLVGNSSIVGNNAIDVSIATATTGTITQACVGGGTLNIGSSQAADSVIKVSDTGANLGTVTVGGNGAANILMAGSNGSSIPAAVVRTDAASSATLNLGSSVANPQTVFVTDAGAANTGFVDITKGTALGTALRLQGYGASSAGAIISTNASVGANQRLNIQSAINNANPNILIQDTATTMYTPMSAGVGYSNISSQSLASGGDIGNVIYALTNPAAVGLYNIMVRVGDNVALNINGQMSSVGFWNGTIWSAGGTNISPPVGTGNVVISFGTNASRTTLYLQNTGTAQLQQVVVYMIPQLLGLGGVIT